MPVYTVTRTVTLTVKTLVDAPSAVVAEELAYDIPDFCWIETGRDPDKPYAELHDLRNISKELHRG